MSGRATRLRAFLAEAPALGPGTLVSERVRLKEAIAAGGMGTVWRAEHVTLGVDVAVKLLTDDVRDDPDALVRFQNEASTASKLASAHVVKILDFGLFQGETPYLVMELLAGEDLASFLAREGPRPFAQVSDIVTQAARGLTAAHDVGFIHRDVKPQNLFLASVDGAKVVKLLDFGVARRPVMAPTSTTKTGQLLGTPLYMGPEQLTNPTEIDARADLWSLAVVAYEALTGALPFKGDTVGALAIAVDRGQFELPGKRDPRLGRGVDRWFQKAFAREPGDRFQTADELATTFRGAVDRAPPGKLWPYAAALAAAAGVGAIALASAQGGDEPMGASNAAAPSAAAMTALAPSNGVAVAPQTSASSSEAASTSVVASRSEPSAERGQLRKTSPPSTATSVASPAPLPEPPPAVPTASEKPRKDRGF